MLDWLKISLVLCIFGFLKEIRPSESFEAEYLIYPWRNITAEELNKVIWPYMTYSTAIHLIFVLLLTDFLRYKPMIIVTGLSGIVTWALMVWTTSYTAAILLNITFGTYSSTEVAYYTYIYAKVDKEHYLKVTSHTRAAILCGKFLSGVLGQVLLYTQLMDLREMTMISFGAQVAATAWLVFLPSVKSSLYFKRDIKSAINLGGTEISVKEEPKSCCYELKANLETGFQVLWLQFKTAFSNRQVQMWSFWYAAGMCGHLQIVFYAQMLWISIDNSPELNWNGAVEAVTTLCAAGMVLLTSRIHENLLNTSRMLWSLVVISLLQASCLFLATNTTSRLISYAGFIVFYILHVFTITVCSAEIAKKIPEDSFGLIFGFNTFAAMVLQSILALFVATDIFGFNFDVKEQFNIYAYLYVILGLIYLIPIGDRLTTRKPKLKAEEPIQMQIKEGAINHVFSKEVVSV